MNIDDIFAEIGGLGLQQWKYVACISFVHLYFPTQMLAYPFVARKTDFECYYGNGTADNSCPDDESSECKSFTFENADIGEWSIVAEWSLVCDR